MHPYTSNVRKSQYLMYREYGKTRREVARPCNLVKSTAANIWKRSLVIKEEWLTINLPSPEIKELISVKKKSRRPLVLSVDNVTEIFKACILNKKNCKKQQHHVTTEESFKACRRTIETWLWAQNLYRLKSMKKLALTDIQKA